jgi:hypothetical protein
MRGPRITIRCDCGEIGYANYGATWACRKCRRSWNTGQIPAEEYWGIMAEMRRFRLTVMGSALALVLPIAALAFVLGFRLLLLMPIIMSFWFIFYMPRWRRKVRARARSLSKWKLSPE